MTRYRNLFLYLAIACFAGIVAIFVFAGYLGIHDTVYVSTGEYQQVIGPDYWQGQSGRGPYPYSIGAAWGEPVRFRYEVDNRRLSAYSATVEVSLLKSEQKVLDLFRQDISLDTFGRVTLEWTLSPADMERAGLGIGQYTVKIKRGDTELGQGIVLGFHTATLEYPPKPVLVPAPAGT